MPPILRSRAERPAWARAVIARRRTLGLTQREVADLAGVAERTIIAIEQGRESVSLGHLLDALRVLGVHLEVTPGRGGTISVSGDA